MGAIRDSLRHVEERIAKAVDRSGRKEGSVRLVAVSKTVEPVLIAEALDAGVRILGENYVQDSLPKIAELDERVKKAGAEWHFIGSLQSNKAKKIVGPFSLLHSCDRWSLVTALEKERRSSGRSIPVLVEVNVAGERTKSGVPADEAEAFVERISTESGLEVRGLMVFPPLADDPNASRPFFAKARSLAEGIASRHFPRISMAELSMGVTSDFEVAIEEGATLVRVGTAIFGARST